MWENEQKILCTLIILMILYPHYLTHILVYFGSFSSALAVIQFSLDPTAFQQGFFLVLIPSEFG